MRRGKGGLRRATEFEKENLFVFVLPMVEVGTVSFLIVSPPTKLNSL